MSLTIRRNYSLYQDHLFWLYSQFVHFVGLSVINQFSPKWVQKLQCIKNACHAPFSSIGTPNLILQWYLLEIY